MRTIRQELTRKLLLSFLLLLALGGVGVFLATRAALLHQFDTTLRTKVEAISSATEQRGARIEVEFAGQFGSRTEGSVAPDLIQLSRGDGTIVWRSGSTATLSLPAQPFGRNRRLKFWNLVLPSGGQGRAVGYRFMPKNPREREAATQTTTAELTLIVASDRREVNETLIVLAVVLLTCGALLLLATMLIVPHVLTRELAPVGRLAQQSNRINADTLSSRFTSDSFPGELRPISDGLNKLLSRLEQSFDRERRFSADLAHELRTPIAELRALAEVALKWPETRPTQMDRDVLATTLQMEGIVVVLLDMLRSENGQLITVREPIRLGQLVESAWFAVAERADKKQLIVTRNVPDDAQIESDPVLIRSILTNLLDNAVEYTPLNGTIQLDIGVGSQTFTVRITNSVKNVESGDLSKFFERFWRKDPSRSHATHSGLGLPLARAFAQSLGCDLAVALDGNCRIHFTLSGPVVPNPTKLAAL